MKLNLGCGAGWSTPGWIGVDYSPVAQTWQKGDVEFVDTDLAQGLPFSNQSVDHVFSSHALEHFTFCEGAFILYECFRTLKVGGTLSIVVPDLDKYVGWLQAGSKEFLGDQFVIGGSPRANLTDNFLMNFYSDPRFNNTCHKYAYNYENLSSRLAEVGFSSVERVGFHEFSYCIELRAPQFRSTIPAVEKFSLCVQARKERNREYALDELFLMATRFKSLGADLAKASAALQTEKLFVSDLRVELSQIRE